MKTLYIHTGQHKTGTSSLQDVLFINREKLNEENISFLTARKNNFKRCGNSSRWINTNKDQLSEKGGTIKSIKSLVRSLSKLPNDVIMSAENFSWIFDKNQLILFKEELSKYFDKIIIITYIRRQDKHTISHHQQGSRLNSATKNFFGSEPKALTTYNKVFDNYLDYYKRISMWGDVFGDENIIIRIFDKKLLYKGDIVLDFYHLLNIKHTPSTLHTNVSGGFELTKVSHLMNSMNLNKSLKKIIYKNLDNSGKLMPCKSEAESFYSQYRESNKKLNERFKISELESIFDDDFSMYSDTPQDKWTEETSNQAITNILTSLNNLNGIDFIILGMKLLLKKS